MLALSELLQKVLDLKSATCQALFKDDTLLPCSNGLVVIKFDIVFTCPIVFASRI